jgi:hypothetical protein
MAADMDRPSRSGTTRCPRARRKSRRLARPGRSSRTPKTSSVKIRSHVNVLCVVLRLEALAVSAHSRVLDCRRASCVEGLRRLAMDDDHAGNRIGDLPASTYRRSPHTSASGGRRSTLRKLATSATFFANRAARDLPNDPLASTLDYHQQVGDGLCALNCT